MNGVICEDVRQLIWTTDLPEPELQPGHAIVSIRRIGICGTDLHAYQGQQPFFTYPRILGHELSGMIEAVGHNEQGLNVGDIVSIVPYMHCGRCAACRAGKTNCCREMQVIGVHIDGGMRERIAVPLSHLIPAADLTLDQAALLEPLAIGAHAVRRSALVAGQTVLVIGAGPIGLGVMALARHQGARVIALDMNAERLEFCRSWAGVSDTIIAGETTEAQLLELLDGELPTIVFDATGSRSSMTNAFHLVGHGGTLVFVGLFKGEITFNDPHFHSRELTLMASRNATLDDFQTVRVALGTGFADLERYVTHRCTLEQLPDQLEGWTKPEAGVIKALVRMD
ncbi:zinc-binding alcohol dehydrogenase family protein [Paenibacillus campi]|uniref:zinc-binding alcohol dehydrogenase family protein n=1 Tax=Paenibacillus campi TaxID=3106031 RepID=UPI002AFDF9FC|nr:zinc-binding alcohol dehydrogenase family protein [Paenibacillus sp. SGZ-1014]